MKKILALFLILFTFTAYSQVSKIKSFTPDSTEFFNEMESFLRASRDGDGKFIMDEFSWQWYGGKFSDKQRADVYRITNLMLDKKKESFS